MKRRVMTERERLVWAAAFAQAFLSERQHDKAVFLAAETVLALRAAYINRGDLKQDTFRRDALEIMGGD